MGLSRPLSREKRLRNWGLQDLVGKQTNYRGKVVVVDFWATWCHGCFEEMPWFAGRKPPKRAKANRTR